MFCFVNTVVLKLVLEEVFLKCSGCGAQSINVRREVFPPPPGFAPRWLLIKKNRRIWCVHKHQVAISHTLCTPTPHFRLQKTLSKSDLKREMSPLRFSICTNGDVSAADFLNYLF